MLPACYPRTESSRNHMQDECTEITSEVVGTGAAAPIGTGEGAIPVGMGASIPRRGGSDAIGRVFDGSRGLPQHPTQLEMSPTSTWGISKAKDGISMPGRPAPGLRKWWLNHNNHNNHPLSVKESTWKPTLVQANSLHSLPPCRQLQGPSALTCQPWPPLHLARLAQQV